MESRETVGPAYMFNRHFRSYNRLNYNHWMLTEMCGYLLRPEIGPLSDDVCIADIGAGTGIWLFETAATMSKTAQLDGFDSSTIHFPPTPWWPDNVKLTSHDIFQPFPDEYHGKYDVVHARFPFRLMDDKDFICFLRNVTLLLKPEGHIQLFVPDVGGLEPRAGGSLKTSFQRLVPLFKIPHSDPSYQWLTHPSQDFESYGFTLISQTQHLMGDHLKLMWAQNNLTSGSEGLSAKSMVGRTEIGQAMAQALPSTAKETNDTPSWSIPWTCFVARKVS